MGARSTYIHMCTCMRTHMGTYAHSYDHALTLVHGTCTSASMGMGTSVGMGVSARVRARM